MIDEWVGMGEMDWGVYDWDGRKEGMASWLMIKWRRENKKREGRNGVDR